MWICLRGNIQFQPFDLEFLSKPTTALHPVFSLASTNKHISSVAVLAAGFWPGGRQTADQIETMTTAESQVKVWDSIFDGWQGSRKTQEVILVM